MICWDCKRDLSSENFSKNPSRKMGVNSRCKECQRKYFKEYYKKNKKKQIKRVQKRKKQIVEWFREYKKTLFCENCGDTRWYVLDFHHKNGTKKNKDYLLSKLMYLGLSKETLIKKTQECKVLCSNCHREFHYLQRDVAESGPSACLISKIT